MKLDDIKIEKLIKKRLSVAKMRQLLNQLYSDEITFSRMVEIINDESGSLILKELNEKEIERLQKIANKSIIKDANGNPFLTKYAIFKLIESYLEFDKK